MSVKVLSEIWGSHNSKLCPLGRDSMQLNKRTLKFQRILQNNDTLLSHMQQYIPADKQYVKNIARQLPFRNKMTDIFSYWRIRPCT